MKTIIWIIIITIITIVGIFVFNNTKETTVVVENKSDSIIDIEKKKFDKTPSFSLKNYSDKMVSLSDFSDKKALVINSWAVWCPFCKKELADFALLQKEFGDDIAVIAIDRQESLEKAKGFTDSIGISDKITFLMDPSDSFYKSIGGFSMPETIFIDSDNNIIIHKRGPMEFEEMKKVILKIIN